MRFACAVFSLVIGLGLAGTLEGAPIFPDTEYGRVASLFFESFNSGEAEKVRSFTLKHRSEDALAKKTIEQRVEQYDGMRLQIGELRPEKLMEEGESHITIVAFATAAQMWASVKLEFVEEDEMAKINAIAIQPTGDPHKQQASFESGQTISEMLEEFLSITGSPAAAAAFADLEGVLAVEVAGVRASGAEASVELDDRFHIGSVAKSMTGSVIASLIQDGKLSRDDTLMELIPDTKMKAAYKDVTLEEVLAHRSGVPPYTALDEKAGAELAAFEGNAAEQRKAFMERVLNEDPTSRGGFAYSNAGYSLLAHIAEEATGKSWEQLIEGVVFKPLKLHSAGFGWPASEAMPDQPRGHYVMGENVIVQPFGEYELPLCMDPAGDIHTSAKDLVRYAQAHLRGLNGEDTFLKAETIQEIHRPDPQWGDDNNYVAGWVIDEDRHWHNGSAGTFYTLMILDLKNNLASVVMVNSGSGDNEPNGMKLIEAFTESYLENK